MRYRVDATVPWPVDAVHDVFRNRIQRLAAYITGVESVTRIAADDGADRHRWVLSRDAMPSFVAPLLPDDALGFEDCLRWNGHKAQFEVTPFQHADAVRFSGWVALHDDGLDTQVEVEGDFSLTESARARMPDLLGTRGIDTLESAVTAQVRNHVRLACRAVDQLLDDEV